MKDICKIVGLLTFFLLSFGILLGCTSEKTIVVSTNQLIQTNYNYQCLDGTKTFTQIILCYQAQDKAEKAQNKITNDLLKNN